MSCDPIRAAHAGRFVLCKADRTGGPGPIASGAPPSPVGEVRHLREVYAKLGIHSRT